MCVERAARTSTVWAVNNFGNTWNQIVFPNIAVNTSLQPPGQADLTLFFNCSSEKPVRLQSMGPQKSWIQLRDQTTTNTTDATKGKITIK